MSALGLVCPGAARMRKVAMDEYYPMYLEARMTQDGESPVLNCAGGTKPLWLIVEKL